MRRQAILAQIPSTAKTLAGNASRCNLEALNRAVIVTSDGGAETEVQYSCQTTELPLATRPMQWWQPRQYVNDIVSRNIRVRDYVRYLSIATFKHRHALL